MRSFGVSNHDNGPKAVPAAWRCASVTSGQLAGGGDFRSGRLMHGIMRGIRDPRLLVDHRNAPTLMAVACEVIEPRHRAIVDGEGQPLLDQAAERDAHRGLDGAAMRGHDHVPAGMLAIDAVDCAFDAVIDIDKTFAPWRRLIDRREPVAADRDRPAGDELRAVQALPLTEILFSKGRLLHEPGGFRKSRGPDRLGSLMRALQIACVPHSIARQDLSDRLEYHAVAGVAGDVPLAIDVAAVGAHRRMTHPPPPCGDDSWLGRIGHRENPPIVSAVAVRQSTDRLK